MRFTQEVPEYAEPLTGSKWKLFGETILLQVIFSRARLNFWLVVYSTLYAFMLTDIYYNRPKPF